MEGKRTRIDIIGDMLSSILGKGGEIKPTHLMYKSNMSHTQMRLYLDDLIVKDFVRKIKKGNYDYVIIIRRSIRSLKILIAKTKIYINT